MTSVALDESPKATSRAGIITMLVLASFILPHIPILNIITLPISSFTTIIHELGHAIVCVLTGGNVSGISIVSDGMGHGGLTFCQGGNQLLITPAGYLTTALVGCALISLGRYPGLSKPALLLLGGIFALTGFTFMFGTILHGQIVSGFMSMLICLALGGGLVWVALKSNYYWANLVLLFLGVQTGLNALNDDVIVVMQALGLYGPGWSDATNMAQLTGMPVQLGAPLWAIVWTAISIFLMYNTVRSVYKSPRSH
jgi:Peptidase M50B-like